MKGNFLCLTKEGICKKLSDTTLLFIQKNQNFKKNKIRQITLKSKLNQKAISF